MNRTWLLSAGLLLWVLAFVSAVWGLAYYDWQHLRPGLDSAPFVTIAFGFLVVLGIVIVAAFAKRIGRKGD